MLNNLHALRNKYLFYHAVIKASLIEYSELVVQLNALKIRIILKSDLRYFLNRLRARESRNGLQSSENFASVSAKTDP